MTPDAEPSSYEAVKRNFNDSFGKGHPYAIHDLYHGQRTNTMALTLYGRQGRSHLDRC